MWRAGAYGASTLMVFGLMTGAEDVRTDTVLADSYHEECQVEGCSQEELDELDASYNSECLDEGCSTEELNELAGGAQYIDAMLQAFLSSGFVVQASTFQSQMAPPSGQVWWYTGCNSTGLVTAITANVSSLPNGFNDQTLGLQIGGGMANVVGFQQQNFGGASQAFTTNVACLSNSFPAFANNIQSAQVKQ